MNTNEQKCKNSNRCFLIMPISDHHDYPAGHFTKVYDQIISPAIKETGYEPYRVDYNLLSQSIISEIITAEQECPMALCDLSSCNPNVLYELGLRHAYNKPIVLIKDEKTTRIFDIGSLNTHEYKSGRQYKSVMEAIKKIKNAIK